MTALQDWLSIGPMKHPAVKTLVTDLLRVIPQATVDYPRAPKIMTPGVERC